MTLPPRQRHQRIGSQLQTMPLERQRKQVSWKVSWKISCWSVVGVLWKAKICFDIVRDSERWSFNDKALKWRIVCFLDSRPLCTERRSALLGLASTFLRPLSFVIWAEECTFFRPFGRRSTERRTARSSSLGLAFCSKNSKRNKVNNYCTRDRNFCTSKTISLLASVYNIIPQGHCRFNINGINYVCILY